MSANATQARYQGPRSVHPDRWDGVVRPYGAEDVRRLGQSIPIEHTIARHTAEKLWGMMKDDKTLVRALGALSGVQAQQMVQAGLKAIYISGWQVAGDNNLDLETYPDQSLYPANSVPKLVERINNALLRADQRQLVEGKGDIDWIVPQVADAEAGFGGNLNAYQLMRGMIKAGAAGVHFEDQLSSAKKCGHLGGKVLVPTQEAIQKLVAARLAADVMDVPTVLIARTDAHSAKLITSDIDPTDHPYIRRDRDRTSEGFLYVNQGVEACVIRGRAFAPYCDMIWMETSTPDMGEAREFAQAIHEKFPGKMLAYNCSPSFNWKKKLNDREIAEFQETLHGMGYKYQFITLAGFHAQNYALFDLAHGYRDKGMTAYVALQQREIVEGEPRGYRGVEHQSEVGVGVFDEIQNVVTGGKASTTASGGDSTMGQFEHK